VDSHLSTVRLSVKSSDKKVHDETLQIDMDLIRIYVIDAESLVTRLPEGIVSWTAFPIDH
jgi:hypothetical protein